jgi:hypothetical protein
MLSLTLNVNLALILDRQVGIAAIDSDIHHSGDSALTYSSSVSCSLLCSSYIIIKVSELTIGPLYIKVEAFSNLISWLCDASSYSCDPHCATTSTYNGLSCLPHYV